MDTEIKKIKEDTYFLRGARVIQALEAYDKLMLEEDLDDAEDYLEEEQTFSDLETNVKNFRPKTKRRQYAIDTIQIAQMKIIPYIGTRALYIKGLARNIKNQHKYDTSVFFSDVQFEDENTPDNITFMANDSKEYNIQPIELKTNNVRVRCNCLDFYFRFSQQNYGEKAIFGPKPKTYVRKTLHYPPVNPDNVTGMCKHLLKTFKALEQAHLVIG